MSRCPACVLVRCGNMCICPCLLFFGRFPAKSLGVLLLVSCTKEGQKAAIHATDAACEIVELATSEPLVDSICMVEKEVGDALERVIEAQQKKEQSTVIEVKQRGQVTSLRVVMLPKAERELRRVKIKFASKKEQ